LSVPLHYSSNTTEVVLCTGPLQKLPGHYVGSVQGCRTISYVSVSRLITRIVGTVVSSLVGTPSCKRVYIAVPEKKATQSSLLHFCTYDGTFTTLVVSTVGFYLRETTTHKTSV
jgi:hypothetical protein